MHIEPIVVGAFEVNCFLAWAEGGAQALVIDPGDDAGLILEALGGHKLSVAGYLVTHGHADHISALAEVQRRHPAPVHISRADAAWAFRPSNQIPPFYSSPQQPVNMVLLEDGQQIAAGGLSCVVIATPGHSPGGVCFYFQKEQILFAGDTLFQNSVGRTDIPGGDPRVLGASLKKLAALPEATQVFPGHGASTSIGQEKAANFFLRNARG